MSSWPRGSRAFLIGVAVFIGLLSLLIGLPFLSWILIGAILAYVLVPVDNFLSRRVSPGISAGLAMIIGIFLVLLPLVIILGVAASQARQLIEQFDPDDVSQIDDVVADFLGITIDTAVLHDAVTGAVKTGARGLAGNLFSIIGGLPELFIGFTVMLFVLFYLLRDGIHGIEWVRSVLPMDPDVREELFSEINQLLYNSLVGTVVVAGAQAVLLGLAFFVLDLTNVVFWTVATFVASLIPLVRASIIWFPASIYLALIGRPIPAVALLVFGALVISTADNIIRPMVMRRGSQLSPVLTIIGIFGGIALFGFVGLFIGPIILGLMKLIVEILVRESTRAPSFGEP